MPAGDEPPDLTPREAEYSAEHLSFPAPRVSAVPWLVAGGLLLVGLVVVAVTGAGPGAEIALVVAAAVGVVWLGSRAMAARPPSLLVDREGLHADGRVVRWDELTGIQLTPPTGVASTMVVGSTNGEPLRCRRSAFRCRLSRVEQLVGLWSAAHGPADPAPADGRGAAAGTVDLTEEDWTRAEAAEAADDEWQAFVERADPTDDDPFRR